MGRINEYNRKVAPYLAEVSEMALTMTEKQIASTLGVAYSSFRTYKKQYPALVGALKSGRRELVKELYSDLIRKAQGFEYEEKKITKEKGVVTKEEIYFKQALPDIGAIHLLLKNYDSENWSNDPALLKIKQEELEIKKKLAEENIW